jgi:hypothetical protein
MKGLYFKGQSVQAETIVKDLGSNYRAQHLANRIWAFTDLDTKKTIIVGDEGNSWYVKITEGENKQAALQQLKVKLEREQVFTSLTLQLLAKDGPSEGAQCLGSCKKCQATVCFTNPDVQRLPEIKTT